MIRARMQNVHVMLGESGRARFCRAPRRSSADVHGVLELRHGLVATVQPSAPSYLRLQLEIAPTTSKFKRFDRLSSFWPPRTQNLAEIVTPRLLAIGGGTGGKAGLPEPFQPKPAGLLP